MSIDMAAPMRSLPMTSPIAARRTGLSAAQAMPLAKEPTATCQTASRPEMASAASATSVTSSIRIMPSSDGAPLHPLGGGAQEGAEQPHRQQPQHGDQGDAKGERVCWNTKMATASVSTQRTTKATMPAYHRRQKSAVPNVHLRPVTSRPRPI